MMVSLSSRCSLLSLALFSVACSGDPRSDVVAPQDATLSADASSVFDVMDAGPEAALFDAAREAAREGAAEASFDAAEASFDAPVERVCEPSCSADLHSVVDCDGRPLSACAADQGCSAGVCIPACEAARAAGSTLGCEFYIPAPATISPAAGACFAAFVANAWDRPVTLTLERNGVTFDVTRFARIPSGSGSALTYVPLPSGGLPAGQVAILFLSSVAGSLVQCPGGVSPAVSVNPAVTGTGRGQAFRLSASGPVVAYDLFPFGGGSAAATSATLLLPLNSWRQRYVVANAYPQSAIGGADAMPYALVVASENNTTVTLAPNAAVVGGAGVPAGPAGTPQTYTLQRGETLQWVQPAELTGSVLTADRPVGVWGGATCLNIPVRTSACDTAHQQLPPSQSLGSQYAAVRYRNRYASIEESPPWRLVGVANGTVLTYEPAAPPGAPMTLMAGQVAEFNAPGPFVVSSQDAAHPFYFAAYMTSCTLVGPSSDCRGDPEFVNVVPTAQFLSRYTLFTDPTYPETSLVVVRRRLSAGFADVTLDCLGTLTGWQPLGADHQYARVDLVTGNFQPVGACNNGVHSLQSDAPFGVTVWGWGSAATGGTFGSGSNYSQAVSYAYPGGAALRTLNSL